MTEAKQPFQADDLFLDQRISTVNAIAGGPLAVCAVRTAQRDDDQYSSVLWLFDIAGDRPARQLTQGPGLDTSPRWSPDGRQIAFLSDRLGGPPQLFVMPADGGEARCVVSTRCAAVAHAWRPGGRQVLVLYTVAVDPDDRAHGARVKADLQREARPGHAPEVVWRLPYKADGKGYQLDSRVHAFLVDVEGGNVEQLTSGDFDVREAVWAPDGGHVAFTRTRSDEGRQHCTDLWQLAVGEDGARGEAKRLSFETSNSATPSWSPDGRWIAFSGAAAAGDAMMSLWLCDVGDGRVWPLGSDSIEVVQDGELHWRADSSGLAFIRACRGLQRIENVAIPTGETSPLLQGGFHVEHLAATDRLVYTLTSPARPLELFSCDWDCTRETQLSHFNAWWQQRLLPRPQLRQFRVPDGDGGSEEIDGWLLLPPLPDGVDEDDRGRSGPWPLLVDVHGGPASYVLLGFSHHAYWQLLCSRGWAVLALNAAGSSSYGRGFAQRLHARWGELDLPQQRSAVEALQDQGVADQRVGICGGSYGGYLAAWAVGNCDTFRVAVVCSPVGNLEAHFGTSDSGYYTDPYALAGKPEADRELMLRLSPMAHIEKVCAPTLFLQGKDDERCPKGQSEELFVKLRCSGKAATELVMYPGGSHQVFGSGRPSHRRDALQRSVDWLERWVTQPLPSKGGAGRDV